MLENTEAVPAPGGKTSVFYGRQRYITAACIFIGLFVAYIDRVNVSVLAANEPFLAYMGITDAPVQIGMMMSLFLIVYGASNFFLSPLGDIMGPRRAMMLCIGLWTVSLFVGGIAVSFSMIIISRIILGIGEGFYYPLQTVLVKNWFPKRERGRANALWTLGQSMAPAVAMPFFTYLIGNFGWRSNFWVCLFLGLVPLYMLWRYVTDTPRQHKKISAEELKYIESGQEKDADLSGMKLLERVKIFAFDYRYWLLLLWYLCMQCMYWGLVTWLPVYLKLDRGFSWTEMGWLASLPFWFSIGTKALSGVVIDKIGRSAPILMISMSFSAGFVYLGASVDNNYVSALMLAMAVAMCAFGTPAVWTLCQGLVPAKAMSTAAGMLNGMTAGLASLSPAFIGLFIALNDGQYSGGLLGLVFTGIVATIMSGILTFKKH